MTDFVDANYLFKAYKRVRKHTHWKSSVKEYGINLLQNISDTQSDIRFLRYKPKSLYEFKIHERGRERLIKAHQISDRIIHRSLCDNVLFPEIRKRIIYDNYASLAKRGTSRALKRFMIMLQKAHKEYGDDAVVVLMDFSKYFDNVQHDIIKKEFSEFCSPDVMLVIDYYLKQFRIDVSYLTEEELKSFLAVPFNAIDYNMLPDDIKTGEKFIDKSVGIGGEPSQAIGVYYPYPVDNLVKIVLGVKYYGRYMDDSSFIAKDKQDALNKFELICDKCNELGIYMNRKKVMFKNIHDWITFLKINFKILESGRVIKKVSHAVFQREYRRLRKHRQMLDENRIEFENVLGSFRSVVGTYSKFHSGYKILHLQIYFNRLFKKELLEYEQRKRCKKTRAKSRDYKFTRTFNIEYKSTWRLEDD